MEATSRDAEALIRTSVQSIAQNARMETFKANDDVIDGVQWLSTLDLRTTSTCQALSGQSWKLDGEKMEGTELDFPGPPPIHFNCRSGLTVVLKSWGDLIRDAKGDKELAKRMDAIEEKLPKSTQANMDGKPVSSTMNYEQWLKSQSEERQIEALGEGRWELWRNGDIALTDLVGQNNRPLTLEELRAL
jgi:SPP1 gp7 family putative phage head morphogenesis protein